ncbi:MAG: hypothetical protein ACK57I_11245 [Akkermansiaceae bacterium]|jgi:hypothetical protein
MRGFGESGGVLGMVGQWRSDEAGNEDAKIIAQQQVTALAYAVC